MSKSDVCERDRSGGQTKAMSLLVFLALLFTRTGVPLPLPGVSPGGVVALGG